ncbi:hypothetical protein E3P99_03375 [Wallemia hederae]|uniref:Amine oxidase domain-containing protein n=1 Tax=Wallemia hederae TaxID=1540922 RepID=A0A4T0FGS6_9BASI|nr:hypothetical protein E3P99_03375 [Wallemia hederae]
MPHKSDSIIPDVIVIGGGFSSAILTHTLSKQGYTVIVLEASERLGGRLSTIELNGRAIDAGCSFVHGYSDSHPLHALSSELGVEIEYAGATKPAIISNKEALDDATAATLQTALTKAIEAAKDSKTHTAHNSLKKVLLESLESTIDGKETLALATAYINSLDAPLGMPVEEVTDLTRFGWEKPLDGKDALVKGGYAVLFDAIWQSALDTGKVTVLKEQKCVSISTKDKVKTIVSTTRGQLESKVIVCTVPLSTLSTIEFHPPLPAEKQSAIADTRVGLLEKLICTYKKNWWGDRNSFTILPTRSTHHSAKEVLESHVLNVQAFENHPTLLIYLPPGAVRLLAMYSKQEVENAGAEVLAESLGGADVDKKSATPLKTHLTTWKKDSNSNGATTTYCTPQQLRALQTAVADDRLGFGGEHTEIDNHGSVNGAVLSGLREAKRVAGYLERRAAN